MENAFVSRYFFSICCVRYHAIIVSFSSFVPGNFLSNIFDKLLRYQIMRTEQNQINSIDDIPRTFNLSINVTTFSLYRMTMLLKFFNSLSTTIRTYVAGLTLHARNERIRIRYVVFVLDLTV